METPEEQLAAYPCIKFEGARVNAGTITIADIQEILAGIEHAAKYFIGTDYPAVKKDSYQIEVRVESGSLITYLVGVVCTGGVGVATAFGIGYANRAGEKLAENDIGDKTTADILAPAVRKMKSTVRIAKHLGGMGKQQVFPKATVVNVDTVVLPNEKGEEIQVTKAELDTYARAPRDTFKKMTSVVDDETSVRLYEPGEIIMPETDVTVPAIIDGVSKPYFGGADADDGVVFPEWQHGERLTLRGVLCRANTNTNTLGFVYDGHTLTSYLYRMEIQGIKESLFDKEVEVEVVVIRTQKKMDSDDELKRPKLEIRKITTIGDLDVRQQNVALALE